METAQTKPMLTQIESLADATTTALTAIGLRIKEIRLKRGMTLQTLSDASGLSPSMLSLVERGRASPSIGSLVVIASSLGVSMSDLIAESPAAEEQLVVRSSEAKGIETAQHVIRRVLREDKSHDLSIALNEYEPNTGNADRALTHDGFEYGFILEGTLTVTIDDTPYVLQTGDLISYSSRRPHQLWNHGKSRVRTLWFNLAHN
jgi:transcriptional regulator with XRE-family HTH domain